MKRKTRFEDKKGRTARRRKEKGKKYAPQQPLRMLQGMVPVVGVEPTRYRYQRILSYLRQTANLTSKRSVNASNSDKTTTVRMIFGRKIWKSDGARLNFHR